MLESNEVIDLQAAAEAFHGRAIDAFSSTLEFLKAGEVACDAAAEAVEFVTRQKPPHVTHSLDAIRLHAPILRPASIRDCMAFERHLLQATRTVVGWRLPSLAKFDRWLEERFGRGFLRVPSVWREMPVYYKGNPSSVVGHDAEIHWPSYTEKLDFELEFGVFIGRMGRDIPADKARDYIAGYTIFNDFSARDIQLREMQGRLGPAKGKDFDTGNALGPYLVTPDETPDPYRLTMRARVNSEQWSCGTSGEMAFTFADMIAHISKDETLQVGDFIGSGTVPGGCGLELDRWLSPGDVVELEIDGLGMLRNRVKRFKT